MSRDPAATYLDVMGNASSALLAICFFVSGATSLVLEVVWAKQLGYSLGNSVHATSTVIAAFMAGLGLGSLLAGRPSFSAKEPIRAYGAIQLLIGVTGFFSIPILRATEPLFTFAHQDLQVGASLFVIVRFFVVLPLMALPATLMGMSLPLVVEARRAEQLEVAANAGLFYGLNTLGAVTGTYLAGFVLIPTLGLDQACRATGVVDFAVGLTLLGLASRSRRRSPSASAKESAAGVPTRPVASGGAETPLPTGSRRLFALVFGLSGFLSMVYEVAWFRLLANVLGGTVHAFASMLGVFLIGVGMGSVLGTAWLPRRGSPFTLVAIALLSVGAGAMASLALANALPMAYADLFWAFGGGVGVAYVLAQAAVAAIVVLPTALAMGALFPIALRAYERTGSSGQDRTHASEIYGLNTFGGICGSLIAGFVLLPTLGLTRTLMISAACSSLLGLFVLVQWGTSRAPRRRIAIVGVGALAFAAALVPPLDQVELHRGVFYRMRATREGSRLDSTGESGLRVLYYREGLQGSVSVMAGDDLALHISGKPVATTEFHDRVHLALLGHLPLLFAKDPRAVAVIGLGSGVALGALATHARVDSIDVAELEPGVFEVQDFFAAVNRDALEDPRVRLVAQDGRTHLAYSETRYDVITSDPISPLIAGAANLYTEDFYRLAAARMQPGGVFCQWWEMSGVSMGTYQRVLATLRGVFPHVLVFVYGVDSVVLGSNEPFAIDWSELTARMERPRVQSDLAYYGFASPIELLGLLWADGPLLDTWLREESGRNTDDNVWLEHRMPLDHYAHAPEPPLPPRMARALADGRFEAIQRAVQGVPTAALIEQVVRNPPTASAATHDALLPAVRAYAARAGLTSILPKLADWHAERRTPRREAVAQLAWERRLDAALGDGDEQAAEQHLRALANQARLPISYYWRRRLIEWLEERGRFEAALREIEMLRRRHPSHAFVYRKGLALARQVGDQRLAARYEQEQRRFAPRRANAVDRDGAGLARVLLRWADRLQTLELDADAIRYAERVLTLDPRSLPARLVRGASLRRLGRVEEALLDYETVLERSPDRPQLHTQVAGMLAGLRRHPAAIAHLRRAVELDPDAAGPHALWAELLRREGRIDDAIAHLEAAVSLDPRNPSHRRQLRALRRR